jgi:RNA recognition motif-containing protein
MNLFVAGLPFDMDDHELREIFEDYGKVSSAKIILDKETGKSRGFGFVDMAEREAAENVIKKLNGGELEGKKLTVQIAEDRKKNTSGRQRTKPRR